MNKFFIFALFVVLISAEHLRVPNVTPVATDCGDSSYLVHFEDISVTSMQRGKPMTLDSGEAEIAKSVKAGDLKIKAVASGTTVLDTTTKAYGDSSVKLPLNLGTINVSAPGQDIEAPTMEATTMTCTLPIITPSGTYSITLDATTTEGEKLYCLNVTFKL